MKTQTIGEFIRAHREAQNMSIRRLEKLSSVSRTKLLRIETGKADILLRDALDIMEALKISKYELLDASVSYKRVKSRR